MPIYAYKCESCGHAKDLLQKMSDTPLTDCPACGKPTWVKQVTAAGFQLKGSGWYVTDFRGGHNAAPKAGGDDQADASAGSTTADASGADSAKPASSGSTESSAAPSAPATTSTPAPSSSSTSSPGA
ncbi:MAG: zinc ribbon domain-containing protein [Betaproteobacteria bacterium]|nr:zinc ribbon domain-containing protein [Betaproteobacteria bacterium]